LHGLWTQLHHHTLEKSGRITGEFQMSAHDHLFALHSHYCALTGLELKFSYEAQSLWYMWDKEGNTVEDLELTVKYIHALYRKRPDILTSCLRIRRLIGDTLFFGEMLAEGRKILRAKQNADKSSVLRATGRESEPAKPARSAAEILEANEAFNNFLKLKQQL
jgi:hypothetical protein